MWNASAPGYLEPSSVLHAIKSAFPAFRGFQQHDSQVRLVLSGIFSPFRFEYFYYLGIYFAGTRLQKQDHIYEIIVRMKIK